MVTKNFKFENGDEVKEKITGFQGIITGTCFYITGCNQYLVTAQSDGKEAVNLWYDEGRLEFIKKAFKDEDVRAENNGCDTVPTIGVRGA